MLRRLLPILLMLIPAVAGFSQTGTGVSTAAAELYTAWAEQAINDGRWPEALAILERGGDFADVSSDISFLLAKARYHENSPSGAVLEALRRGFEALRWTKYSAAEARLLEAEILIRLRNFTGALTVLSKAPVGADTERLRLLALKGFPDKAEFRRVMAETLDRYPRDPRPVEILFAYASAKNPEENDLDLISLALQRLPCLLEADPHLAYMAAPFIRDTAEARRLVQAYRAVEKTDPASIPVSLNLGLIDEAQAIEELFASFGSPADRVINKDLILSVWALLRNQEGRDMFKRNLLGFSGVITEDADRDGWPETRVYYRNGAIEAYFLDTDQDGLTELHVNFAAGLPFRAEQVIGAEPAAEADRSSPLKLYIDWEQYPAVRRAELGTSTELQSSVEPSVRGSPLEKTAYIPRPGEFRYTPVRFSELTGGDGEPGLRYPEGNMQQARLNRRTLVSFALQIERPSAEFKDAVEIIDMENGIPWRAAEYLAGRPVTVTEFVRGQRTVQRLDMDLDSRMETVRHFRSDGSIESVESDWDGNGTFETGEQFLPDGSIIYSWDTNGDGLRDYSETRQGN
ncbi:hypothetical protein FACS189476_04510 [Spirochaetia bacterium]|nr:hypothetical protein FACS189476_04510 [Spirochaetia bacterium]